MAKPADLRRAMSVSAKSASRNAALAVQAATDEARIVETSPLREGKSEPKPGDNPHYRPGRAAKSNVTGYFPQAVKKQLRLLAAERDTTIQRLLAEALNGLFAANGKPEIAPLDDA
jgi:hypothetical protein